VKPDTGYRGWDKTAYTDSPASLCGVAVAGGLRGRPTETRGVQRCRPTLPQGTGMSARGPGVFSAMQRCCACRSPRQEFDGSVAGSTGETSSLCLAPLWGRSVARFIQHLPPPRGRGRAFSSSRSGRIARTARVCVGAAPGMAQALCASPKGLFIPPAKRR